MAQTKKPIVLIVLKGDCCPDVAWTQAEDALIEEAKTLDVIVKTVAAPIEISSDSTTQIVDMLTAFQVNAIISVQIDAEDSVRMAIATRGPDNQITVHPAQFPEGPSPAVLDHILLSGIETLRSGLLFSHSEEMTTPPPPPPPPPPSASLTGDARAHKRFAAGVGAGVVFSPGGVHPGFGAGIEVMWHLLPAVTLNVDAMWAPGSRVDGGGDAISFCSGIFRGFVYGNLFRARRLGASFGAGAGTAVVSLKEDASPSGSTDRDTLAYLGMAGRFRLDFNSRFGMLAGMRIGFLVPDVTVHVDRDELATYGRPLLDGSLLLTVRWGLR